MSKDLKVENVSLKKKIQYLTWELNMERIRSKHIEIVSRVVMNRLKVTKEESEVVKKVLDEYLSDDNFLS